MVFPNINYYDDEDNICFSLDFWEKDPISIILDICEVYKRYQNREEIKNCILKMFTEELFTEQEVNDIKDDVELIVNTEWKDIPLFPIVKCNTKNRKGASEAYYALMTRPNVKKHKSIMLALYNILYFFKKKAATILINREDCLEYVFPWPYSESNVTLLSLYDSSIQYECADWIRRGIKRLRLESANYEKILEIANRIMNDSDYRYAYYKCDYASIVRHPYTSRWGYDTISSRYSAYGGISHSSIEICWGIPFFSCIGGKTAFKTPENWYERNCGDI